jgi:K+-sensing histidine kinase KdpD
LNIEINEKILQLKTLKFSHVNPQLSQVNLNFFVQQLVSSYQSKWTENAIPLTLKIDCPKNLPVFDSNTGYLQRIFDELLINAQKFALKNTNVTLKVRESQDNNQPCLVLKLSNLTQSVKCKNSRYFFDPFYREQWVIDTAIPGLGLGLTTTKELVEQLNAKIKVTCASADVPEHCLITFTLTFPLNPNG